ncbi:ribose-phosphate diphosphokinase [Oceanimonas baumannii]|uniref:Ribose-phosphate pyrophosphokinase n=1 Tax=Oceanimonas baumannii TaxID=129578 RepID=A0A235CG91_9GAMM|nr:ribose-phosphate diphosphokinase [Oceanimonas baumannii]OYD23582.1 ribose-phosphate pyrophosphokinase [Oceanimonas baumannii]TDW56880.1 ribose-phosphate pyrophosphokinase [Oceanimonas baumannii]
MTPLLFSLPKDHALFTPLCKGLPAIEGGLEFRRFPDGESYLRVCSDIEPGQPVIILADLSRPDARFLPLYFLCDTLKELGAGQVGLLAPYLCYMRQDTRFHPGEAVTSRSFAHLLSHRFDWLLTVDPHLHRYHALSDIYTIPATTVHATPLLVDWLRARSEPLLLVGPDAESEQWVSALAQASGHPFVVGSKQRRGDRDVHIRLPDLSGYHRHIAIMVDDVISSGQTLLRCARALTDAGIERIEAAAIHGLFADRIEDQLQNAGVQRLITTNSVSHPSNGLDLTPLLLEPLRQLARLADNRPPTPDNQAGADI